MKKYLIGTNYPCLEYLVSEWECLLFAKVKLLGVIVNDLRLRKSTSLEKERVKLNDLSPKCNFLVIKI